MIYLIVGIFVNLKIVGMNECSGRKFVLNGTLLTSDMFDKSLLYEGESVYEVIRMVKGNPVFFDDHMKRLETSLKLQHKKPLTDVSRLKRDIINLTKTEKKKEANLKIVFNYNADSDFNSYLIYFIEPVYPSEAQYREGVRGTLFTAERKDPESKVIDHKLRSSIYHKLVHEGAYEALLVNKNGFITEGSRSNIFFIKGDDLITAPDNTVLNGITRKYLLSICRENNINVTYTTVNVENIRQFDVVFMTGTSPVVLPFYCIDNFNFDVTHPMIRMLRNLYIKQAEESIVLFRAD